jgi:hypothetical protein
MKGDKDMKKEFKEDRRQDKPSLHLLYVKWAVVHLKELHKMLNKLHKFSNGNLLSVTFCLQEEIKKLVNENAAYNDAQRILESVDKKYRIYVKSLDVLDYEAAEEE